jgi:drug/metabolite transporter (DMT)-like permease
VAGEVPWFALLVLLAGSSFGLVSTVMKFAYRYGFTVQDVTDGQYLIAAVLLWGITLVWPRGKRVTNQQWLLLGALGLAGAGTSYAYYRALTLLPASLAIVLLFQFSWIVLLMDILVTRRLPSLQKWLGVVMITVGTILAVGLLQGGLGSFPLWAVGLGVLSALFYSCTLYLSAYVKTESSPALRSAITVTVSTIAICCIFPPSSSMVHALPRGLWVWGLLAALFSQVIPNLLMLIAIPRTGGRMAGVLGSIELPVAVLVAHVMLNEVISLAQWIGVILILAGIFVSEWNFHFVSTKFQRKTV